ncbi:MAG: DNA-binding domain-containing protein [Rickettsiales bacterium]|nr:DNA-binding domain-containing protein [Rickettsiales bacterium]
MPWPNIQQDFSQAVMQQNADALISHMSKSQAAKSARINIYRRNILLTLTDALAENYRAVAALVGEAFFAQMAEKFIAQHPPTQANMNIMGQAFPTWLQSYAPAEALPYLPDMARFEYTWNQSFFAKRTAIKPHHFWVDTDPDALLSTKLHFRDDIQLVSTHYPCDTLWRYCVLHKGEGEIPAIDEGEHFFLLHRPERKVLIEPLPEHVWKSLHELSNKGTIESVLESVPENEQAENFQLMMSTLIAHQLIKHDEE